VKCIGVALHLPAKLAHGKVAPLEGAELRIELESPGLGVVEKLALECPPGLVRGAAVRPDDVLEI
jgi:hypothetical protein